ncbi:MAG: HNH endonuclease [Nitrosomonadaceae bacterium]|nr:HNH endonuclease [Nitrosomonadaceae bacterium]
MPYVWNQLFGQLQLINMASTQRYSSKPSLIKGPGGRWLCRCGCQQECQPPRRTFFSDDCVHNYLLRRSGSYLRKCVKKRDHGICAHCQLDCSAIQKEYRIAKKMGDANRMKELKSLYPRLKHNRSYWEADHIIPVVKGGGECVDLNNIRTLCIECHLKETKKLNSELRTTRATKQPPSPG